MDTWQGFFTKKKLDAHRAWMESRSGEGRMVVEGACLHGAKLVELVLAGARFCRCDLSGVDLSRAWLTETEWEDCSLDQAQLVGAMFGSSILSECRLNQADLRVADLSGCRIINTRFVGAQLSASNFTKSLLTAVDFTGASLDGAKLIKASLLDCSLNGASLFQVHTDHAQLTHVDLRGAQVDALEISGTMFSRCGFYGVNGTPFVFDSYTVTEPDFSSSFDGSEVTDAAQVFSLFGRPSPDNPSQ